MKILSVFVDESGDFGPYSKHSPYYIVSMVFHNQSIDINQNIDKLNEELKKLGFIDHVIHTEPLIRKEEGRERTQEAGEKRNRTHSEKTQR